jgi:hypothetical protein
MIERTEERFRLKPERLVADTELGAPMQVTVVSALAHETACLHVLPGPEHSLQPVLQRKLKWRTVPSVTLSQFVHLPAPFRL